MCARLVTRTLSFSLSNSKVRRALAVTYWTFMGFLLVVGGFLQFDFGWAKFPCRLRISKRAIARASLDHRGPAKSRDQLAGRALDLGRFRRRGDIQLRDGGGFLFGGFLVH